jgi:hypothetical protein
MPVLARVYHIPPHEQHRLTLAEFYDIRRDYEQMKEGQQSG